MSRFSIRLARPEDAEAFPVVEEDAASLLREEPGLEGIPLPPAESADHYRRLIAKGHCLCAIEGGELAGFAAAERIRRELHLHELSVRRISQGKGIASTLLRALFIDARNCGLSAITLNTFRDISFNAPFYEKRGFTEIVDVYDRPYLAERMKAAKNLGIPPESRIAMIRFLS